MTEHPEDVRSNEGSLKKKCRYCDRPTTGSDVCAECLKDAENGIDLNERRLLRDELKKKCLEQKQLDKKIAEFEKSIQTIEKELGPIDWRYPEISEEHPFNANELAEMILARPEFGILTDIETYTLYFYCDNSPVYHNNGENYLRSLIEKLLMSEARTHRINEVVELIKIKRYATLKLSQKIGVENGTLCIETKALEPPSKYEFITNRIHAVYNPDAPKYEPWYNFIDEVCPDDKLLLQELSGYCLVKGMPFHVIAWLFGPTGRNGKGTWSRTMKGILGAENVSNVQIHELQGNNRFAAYNLVDSLLNVSNEPNTKYPLSIEMLQALSGKDTLDAEKKNVQKRKRLESTTKLVVIGNSFPSIVNPTEAFWKRLILINFPNTFVGEKQIQDLEDTWLNDPDPAVRSSILNWMIEGRDRLFKNKGFSITKTQEEMIIRFKRASDSVASFLSERVEYDRDSFVSKIAASDAYKDYCEAMELNAVKPSDFNSKLRANSKIKETSKRLGIGKERKKVKGWLGFRLKEPQEEEPEEESQKTLDKLEPQEPLEPVSTSEKKSNSKILGEEKAVPTVPSVPPKPVKPVLNIYKVFNAEPCSCGLFAVEFELHDTAENTRKKCCSSCAKKEKQWFLEHGYDLAYPAGGSSF